MSVFVMLALVPASVMGVVCFHSLRQFPTAENPSNPLISDRSVCLAEYISLHRLFEPHAFALRIWSCPDEENCDGYEAKIVAPRRVRLERERGNALSVDKGASRMLTLKAIDGRDHRYGENKNEKSSLHLPRKETSAEDCEMGQ